MITLLEPPAALSGVLAPMVITVQTDLIQLQYARFTLTCSASGPTASQTLRLQGDGLDLTYTASATTPAVTGLELPLQLGGESAGAYAIRLAAFFRLRSELTALYTVEAVGSEVRITLRAAQVATLTVTSTLSGITATTTNVTTPPYPAELTPVVEVYQQLGNVATDPRLGRYVAAYNLATATAEFDIADSFTHLDPHLPPAATINPLNPVALSYGEATAMHCTYYLRASDDYTTPGGLHATAMHLLSGSWAAIYAGANLAYPEVLPYLRHNKALLPKPIDRLQPDWIYWYNTDNVPDIYINCLIYWSDGTTSVHLPFGSTPVSVSERLYWLPSGPAQLRINTLTPPLSTATDAVVLGYDVRLGPPDEDGTFYLATRRYHFMDDSGSTLYLLFSNGVGGLETIWLRGATATEAIVTRPAPVRVQRTRPDTEQGTIATNPGEVQTQWTGSTGRFDAQYAHYLPLIATASAAGHAWIVDIVRRQFIRVTLDADVTYSDDNQTIMSAAFTLRAAHYDTYVA